MKTTAYLLLLLVALPSLAFGHLGHTHAEGLGHGFMHPLLGLDHILAMVAVGIWAAQSGGRAIWAIPLSFIVAMAVGGALGLAGFTLPMVEPGILASVIILGILIACAARLPLMVSAALVAVFALCHGFAHATEMPVTASGLSYGLGFLMATALLHLAGVGVGVAVERLASSTYTRLTGVGIALGGALIIIA